MNPIVPLAAIGIGAGLYVYSKKTPAKKLAEMQKQQGAYQQASWETHMSVADVQHALNALGANPPLAEDGVLGPKTTAAIKSFQAQAGLSVDGVVGPQTTAALEHAGARAAGWFLLCDDEDCDDDDDDYAVGASAIEAIDRTRPGRGIRQTIEGEHGVKVGAAGWGSNDWTAPTVEEILSDPQQRMQIGLNKMRHDEAVAAFGGAPAAGWDYSFLPDQGASEEAEYGQVFDDLEAERQADLNAVGAAGACCWSAPDEEEALEDPVQQAEMAMQYGPYGYEEELLPYNEALAAEEAALHAEAVGYVHPGVGWNGPPYLPYPTSNEGWYEGVSPAAEYYRNGVAAAAPVPGALQAVNSQGYEFASQAGRKY